MMVTMVMVQVWVDASGDEGDEVPAAADGGAPGEAGAEESTEASTEKKKTKAPESKPKPVSTKPRFETSRGTESEPMTRKSGPSGPNWWICWPEAGQGRVGKGEIC